MDEKSAQHAALPPCAPSIELHNLELSLVRRPLFGAAKVRAAIGLHRRHTARAPGRAPANDRAQLPARARPQQWR